MSQVAEIKGLDELITRMRAYPVQLTRVMNTGMQAGLLAIWSKVPAYPPQNPASTYERTGTLGKSLGAGGDGKGGGATGEPSIYRINALGGGNFEGKFGSNLEYAQYVIGDTTQTQTANFAGWYQLLDVMLRALGDVTKIFNGIGNELAAFLEGKQ